MRYLAVLIVFLCVNLTLNGQTIKFVDMKYQADVNVYFVNDKSEADAIVYVSSYKSYSKKLGIWFEEKFFNNRGIKVFVSSESKADVKVYLTKWRNEVKINEIYKLNFK